MEACSKICERMVLCVYKIVMAKAAMDLQSRIHDPAGLDLDRHPDLLTDTTSSFSQEMLQNVLYFYPFL